MILLPTDIWHCIINHWSGGPWNIQSLLTFCVPKLSVDASCVNCRGGVNFCHCIFRMLWCREGKSLHGYNRKLFSIIIKSRLSNWINFLTVCFINITFGVFLLQFSILLLIVLSMELAAGIAGYIRRSEVETMLRSTLNSTMYDYYAKPDIRNTWDIVQHEVIIT